MPPKVRFTKEQIAEAAYNMVKKFGIDILTARNLAAELGVSTAPIFTAFKNIEEVQEAVKERAKTEYRAYIEEGLKHDIPFKGAGLKYVEFAKNEPELFKMLFMGRDNFESIPHYHPGKDISAEKVLNVVESNYAKDKDSAMRLYNHLSVYMHGFAVMFAQGNSVFTMDDVSRMMSEVFMALSAKEKNI
ncbi:MAG: TetR/AcrR family transcriptional regulator [Clostridia bacterium]|nr:TetR/AcrR family transcriptional regulator [Clostridia bacterium]